MPNSKCGSLAPHIEDCPFDGVRFGSKPMSITRKDKEPELYARCEFLIERVGGVAYKHISDRCGDAIIIAKEQSSIDQYTKLVNIGWNDGRITFQTAMGKLLGYSDADCNFFAYHCPEATECPCVECRGLTNENN